MIDCHRFYKYLTSLRSFAIQPLIRINIYLCYDHPGNHIFKPKTRIFERRKKNMKTSIAAVLLFTAVISLQGQDNGSLNCSEAFWTVNEDGKIQQWKLVDTTVSGGETILYGFSPGLAWCGAENDYTFFSTSYPNSGILYYDNASSGWISIPTIAPVLNNGCSGFHQYYMGTTGIFSNILYYFDGANLDALDTLQSDFYTVADIAVDSAGRAWVFRGEDVTYSKYVDVYDKNGKILTYTIDFNTYNGYGSMFLGNTLYVALGSSNPEHPNSIVPILLDGDKAIPGIPVPFPDQQYTDLANCRGSGSSAVSGTLSGDLQVYPNPTTGEVRIEGANVEGAAVYNIHGMRTAQPASGHIVDLSGMPDGIYFLHIAAGGRQYIRKMVKAGY